jgi:hypothetical protein
MKPTPRPTDFVAPDKVRVTLKQKSRGGITITATT